MIKRKEVSEPKSCLNKAKDEEPIFVLLGRDTAAPGAIRTWIRDRIAFGKNEPFDAQILEASTLACDMEVYQASLKKREQGK